MKKDSHLSRKLLVLGFIKLLAKIVENIIETVETTGNLLPYGPKQNHLKAIKDFPIAFYNRQGRGVLLQKSYEFEIEVGKIISVGNGDPTCLSKYVGRFSNDLNNLK